MPKKATWTPKRQFASEPTGELVRRNGRTSARCTHCGSTGPAPVARLYGWKRPGGSLRRAALPPPVQSGGASPSVDVDVGMHYLLVATSKSLSMVDLSPSTVNPRTCVRPPGSLEPCANAAAPSSVRRKTPCSRDLRSRWRSREARRVRPSARSDQPERGIAEPLMTVLSFPQRQQRAAPNQ